MKTFGNLKEEIALINNIDVEGFDSDWVIKKFARDQALINIKLIKPYADKYELIVRFLVTGKDVGAARAGGYDFAAASDASHAAFASAYAAGAARAADAAAFATDYASVDFTKAIESLNTIANEYLALLLSQEVLGDDRNN